MQTCGWCGKPIVNNDYWGFCGEKCEREYMAAHLPAEKMESKKEANPIPTCAYCGKPLGTGSLAMEDGREVCGQDCYDKLLPSVMKVMKERERIRLESERLQEEIRLREQIEAEEKERLAAEDYERRHAPKDGAVSRLSIQGVKARRAFPDVNGSVRDEFGRTVQAKDFCHLSVGAIVNESSETSGTLRMSLWYCDAPYESGAPKGECVWSEPLHQVLGPGYRWGPLEHTASIAMEESRGDRNVALAVEELHADGRWYCAGAARVSDWGRTPAERQRARERKAARKKAAKAKARAKWFLWIVGIAAVGALWHFAVLPVWVLVLIAVLWSMILAGFFGNIV